MSINNGRVALVTGSTSIGAAIAKRLAKEGFEVALHSRTSGEEGLKLAETLGNASYTKADLAEEDETRQLIHSVLSNHGRLDVLVNNAAIGEVIAHSELRKATPQIWRQLYDVNVIAPWILITEAETALRNSATPEQPSSILNITSHAGVRPKGAHSLCSK